MNSNNLERIVMKKKIHLNESRNRSLIHTYEFMSTQNQFIPSCKNVNKTKLLFTNKRINPIKSALNMRINSIKDTSQDKKDFNKSITKNSKFMSYHLPELNKLLKKIGKVITSKKNNMLESKNNKLANNTLHTFKKKSSYIPAKGILYPFDKESSCLLMARTMIKPQFSINVKHNSNTLKEKLSIRNSKLIKNNNPLRALSVLTGTSILIHSKSAKSVNIRSDSVIKTRNDNSLIKYPIKIDVKPKTIKYCSIWSIRKDSNK